MAKITPGPLISDIRNKAGDVVFIRTKGGLATRAFVMPPEPGTTRQLEMQAAHAAALLRWQTALTDVQRQAWESFAHQFPNTTSINATKPLSGCGAYIQVNMYTYMYGAGNIDVPPIDQNVTQPAGLVINTNHIAQIGSDDFNRADSDDIGPNWHVRTFSVFGIRSNTLTPQYPDYRSYAHFIPFTPPNDQYTRAVVAANPADTAWIGITCRMSWDPINAYNLEWGTNYLELLKWVNGAGTMLGYSGTGPSAGDVMELRAVGDQITALKNGVPVFGPLTDNSIASGAAGITGYKNSDDLRIDNWECGEYPAATKLEITLTTPGNPGEVLLVRATPPLSAGITNCGRHLRLVEGYDSPVTFPLNIYPDWHNKLWWDHDTQTYYNPDLVPGTRIGLEAYFVRKANGTPSGRLFTSSITT